MTEVSHAPGLAAERRQVLAAELRRFRLHTTIRGRRAADPRERARNPRPAYTYDLPDPNIARLGLAPEAD
jgi:hypothetical protein